MWHAEYSSLLGELMVSLILRNRRNSDEDTRDREQAKSGDQKPLLPVGHRYFAATTAISTK